MTRDVVKYSLFGLAGLFAFLFIAGQFGLEWKRYFLPKHMEVEREAWEESQSHIKGAMQDLRKHRREYLKLKKEYQGLPEDSDRKETVSRQIDAIAASVRQRASDLDAEDLEDHPEVRKFVEQMRRNR